MLLYAEIGIILLLSTIIIGALKSENYSLIWCKSYHFILLKITLVVLNGNNCCLNKKSGLMCVS